MTTQVNANQIHVLDFPIGQMSLVVPIANTAEVINYSEMAPIPCSQGWLLGAIGWRRRAVPVISFELMLGMAPPVPSSRAKIVVFNPLNGRMDWEFFGILAISEPHPRIIDRAAVIVVGNKDIPTSPYIASGIRLENRLGLIPNIQVLRQAFYP